MQWVSRRSDCRSRLGFANCFGSFPGAHQMAEAATNAEAVGAVLKVAVVDLCALQEFGAMESQSFQLVLQFRGIEEELEGFSGGGYAFGEGIECLSLACVEQRGVDGEIEDYAAACGHFRDYTQSGH